MHRGMLALQLQRLQLIDQQMAELNHMIARAMKSHQDAVIRLAEVPGLGVDSAQQIIAEVGAQGQYILFGSGVYVLGGNLSGQGRKRGAEP
jgi:transposase